MTENEPQPAQERPRALQPKLARAKALPRLRLAILAIAILAIGGMLYFLKQEAKREQAYAEQIRIEEAAQREAQLAQWNEAITRQYGGIRTKGEAAPLVARVGEAIARAAAQKSATVTLRFHLLAEPDNSDMFALPDGTIYLTTALLNRMQTEGELASILALGAAHALADTWPEWQPASEDPPTPMKLRYPETVDTAAITLMTDAGYDPNAMLGGFTRLIEAYQAGAVVGFFTTHASSADRLQKIKTAITARYPDGLPPELSR
jgi:predicted Zn-dependent protease